MEALAAKGDTIKDMTQPVSLHRLTTLYVAEEDRLRLSAQDEQGQVHLFWLTQRLANQLVSHLGGVLQSQPQADAAPAIGAGKEASRTQARGRAASEAKDSRPSGSEERAPVVPTDATQAWLLQAIDITTGGKGLALTFKVEHHHRPAACLTLAYGDLRQWMNIVYQQYVRGSWSLLAWNVATPSQHGTTSKPPQAHALH